MWHRVRRQEPGWSAGDSRKADGWIIAHWRDGFQRHVAGTLDGPLIVLFEQNRADEADDGILIGEDADHIGAPLDLAVGAQSGWSSAAWSDAAAGMSCKRAHRSTFDFLTWFEYAPEHADAFEDMVRKLRRTLEWQYVDREIDIRLCRSCG